MKSEFLGVDEKGIIFLKSYQSHEILNEINKLKRDDFDYLTEWTINRDLENDKLGFGYRLGVIEDYSNLKGEKRELYVHFYYPLFFGIKDFNEKNFKSIFEKVDGIARKFSTKMMSDDGRDNISFAITAPEYMLEELKEKIRDYNKE